MLLKQQKEKTTLLTQDLQKLNLDASAEIKCTCINKGSDYPEIPNTAERAPSGEKEGT